MQTLKMRIKKIELDRIKNLELLSQTLILKIANFSLFYSFPDKLRRTLKYVLQVIRVVLETYTITNLFYSC